MKSDGRDRTLQNVSKGNEQAFDYFMDQWSDSLYGYAFAILHCRESAEEVVSDVFLEVWKSRGKLPEVENLNSWLHTITYRKAISYLRHQSGEPIHVPIDDLATFNISPVEAPDESVISFEQQRALNKALNELPAKCQHVFFLAKIERIPYKQIMEMLHISRPTVNYHISYAMDLLRKKLRNF